LAQVARPFSSAPGAPSAQLVPLPGAVGVVHRMPLRPVPPPLATAGGSAASRSPSIGADKLSGHQKCSDSTESLGATCTERDGEEREARLVAREAELTRQVPELLEAMNNSAAESNELERRVCEAQERHRTLLEQWTRLYEDLRSEHGAAVDRVKPYFDTAQVLNAASRRVQCAVREFSGAASQYSQAKESLRTIDERLAYGAHRVTLDSDTQDGLSRATVAVLRCQQERDRCEQEYARALREYQEAQELLESWRTQIGDSTIKRVLPCFRQLQQHQQMMASEQTRINTLEKRAKAAKNMYKNSMRELDRINVAVHTARRESVGDEASLAVERLVFGDEPGPLQARASLSAPAGMLKESPETPPEVTPEVCTPNSRTQEKASGKVVTASAEELDSPFA